MDIENAVQLPSGLWGKKDDLSSFFVKKSVRALVLSDSHGSADVVSAGELYTALAAGFPADKLYFHGSAKTVAEIAVLSANSSADILIFLGDGISDIAENASILPSVAAFVRGNNDPSTWLLDAKCKTPRLKIPRILSFSIAGVPLILTHGDSFSFFDPMSDSVELAMANGAAAVLSGHTHRSAETSKNGVISLNPGSISRPRGCPASFLTLNFERGKLIERTFFQIEKNGRNSPFLFTPFIPKEFAGDWIF